jgi:hypothetical protein
MNYEIVTALFDIDRENLGDGRKISDYLLWFEKTLKLNCPMTIFTEEKFIPFVTEKRKNYPTNIFTQKIEDIPFFNWFEYNKTILDSENYKNKMSDLKRVECVNPKYNIIQYSKFGWISAASTLNKFDSDYYFWVDAGLSRFFYDMNIEDVWPSSKTNIDPNKILVQGQLNIHEYLHEKNLMEYVWDNNSVIAGGFFGVPKKIISELNEKVESIFMEYMVKQKTINNEQFIFAILYKLYPEFFDMKIIKDNKTCSLFYHLSK